MESGYGEVRTNGALSGAVEGAMEVRTNGALSGALEGAVSPVIFSPDNALIESG
jgi:hypothetical protein